MRPHKAFSITASTALFFALTPFVASAASEPGPPANVGCDAGFSSEGNIVENLEEANLGEKLEIIMATGEATSSKAPRSTVTENLKDESLFLDECGAMFVEEPVSAEGHEGHAHGEEAGAAESFTPNNGDLTYPASETFKLSSRPGAPRTIYLNFKGTTLTNTGWNQSWNQPEIKTLPFSTDGSSDFSTSELASIQTAWKIMAADFEAWNVNVTTEEPAPAALERSGSTDQNYGFTALIANGTSKAKECGCGGIGYVNINSSSSGSSLKYYSPALVFPENLGNSAKNIAEAASHEVGHNLGLSHDGTSTKGYHGGEAPWAPIMGVGYSQPLAQWSKGEYADANNKEDDLAIITRSFPYLADTAPTSLDSSTPADIANATTRGIIASGGDKKVYRIANASGTTTVNVDPISAYSNFDSKVRVLDASGNVLGSSDTPSSYGSSYLARGLNSSVALNLPTDSGQNVFVEVSGAGLARDGRDVYSSYGSIGEYKVRSTTTPYVAPPPPVVDPPVTNPPVTDPPVTNPPKDEDPQPPVTPEPPVEKPVAFSAKAYTMEVGKAFGTQLTATGGNGKYTWKATSLPSGVTLSSTGAFKGTPTRSGSYYPVVTATSNGKATSVKFTMKVASRISWRTQAALKPVYYKKAFTKKLYIQSGVPGYSWTVSGKLPRGTKLYFPKNGSTSTLVQLKGTPTSRGKYYFKITARDKLGMATAKTFSVTAR